MTKKANNADKSPKALYQSFETNKPISTFGLRASVGQDKAQKKRLGRKSTNTPSRYGSVRGSDIDSDASPGTMANYDAISSF